MSRLCFSTLRSHTTNACNRNKSSSSLYDIFTINKSTTSNLIYFDSRRKAHNLPHAHIVVRSPNSNNFCNRIKHLNTSQILLNFSRSSASSSSSLKIREPPRNDFDNCDEQQQTNLRPKQKSAEDICATAVIPLDDAIFRNLSQEFVDKLNHRNQNQNLIKNAENVWKDVPPLTVASTLDHYAKLAKIKLTGLIVLTTVAGFYMATPMGAMNYSLLAWTLAGTALTSGSAAAWNHCLEVPFDSQMRRTQDRPLVRGAITPLHAASFAFASGVAGLTILGACVNPLTATLGGVNLLLYSFIYTPMKRVHIVNTWIGAIVGAIPPVMGLTAVNGVIDLPAILLGAILFSWQFPHFNALSWNMRHEYARAGYRMMSVTDPALCQRTALRHSALLLACTTAMCATGITHWSFGIDSLPFSLYLIYLAFRFRTDPSSNTSRRLFLYSLIYLPVVMFLMAISKNRHRRTPKDGERKSQSTSQTQLEKLKIA